MRFRYSTTDPSQNEFDSLPRVPIILRREGRTVEALALVVIAKTLSDTPCKLVLT